MSVRLYCIFSSSEAKRNVMEFWRRRNDLSWRWSWFLRKLRLKCQSDNLYLWLFVSLSPPYIHWYRSICCFYFSNFIFIEFSCVHRNQLMIFCLWVSNYKCFPMLLKSARNCGVMRGVFVCCTTYKFSLKKKKKKTNLFSCLWM